MIHEGNIIQNIDIKEYTNTIHELKEEKSQLQQQTQLTQVQLDQNSSFHLQELFKQRENYQNIIKELQDQIKVQQTNIKDINKQLQKENHDFNKVINQQQDEIKRLINQNQILIRQNSQNEQKIKLDKESFEKTLKEQKLKFQKKILQQQKEFEEQVESQKQQNDILIQIQEDKTLKEIKLLNQQIQEQKLHIEEINKQLSEEKGKFTQLESILDNTNKDFSQLKTKYHSDMLYRQVMIGNAEKKQIQYEKDLTHYKELYISIKEKYQIQENNYQAQIRKLNEGTINLREEIDKLMQMIQNQEEQYQSIYNCLGKHIKFNDEPANDQINKYLSRQQAQINLLNGQIKQLEENLNQKSYQENITKKQIENQNFEIVRLQKQVWEQKEMIHAYEMASLKQSQLIRMDTDKNQQDAKEKQTVEYQDFSQQYKVPNNDKSVGNHEPEKQQQQKQQQQEQQHDVMVEKHPYYSIFNNQRPKSKRNSLLQVPAQNSIVIQEEKSQPQQSIQVSYNTEQRKKSDDMQVSIQENNSNIDEQASVKCISIQTSQILQPQQIEIQKQDQESQFSIFMIDRRLSCHIYHEQGVDAACQTEGNLQQIANQHYLRKIVELENDYETLNKTYKMQLQQDYVKNMKLILNKQTQSDVSYQKSNHIGSQTETQIYPQMMNQLTIESQQKLKFDDQLTNIKTAQDTIELKLNRPIQLDASTQTKVYIKLTSTDEQQKKDDQIQKANSILIEKGKLEQQIESKDKQLLELQEQIQMQNQLINQQKQSLRSQKKSQVQNTTNPNLNTQNLKHNRETQTVLIDLEILLLEQEKQLYQANHIIKYLNLELENYKQNYSLFSNCKEFQRERIKPLELKQINTKRNDSSMSYQQSPRSTILPVLDEQPSSNRNSSAKKYRQRNRSLFQNPFDQEIMKNAYKLVNSLKDPVKV